MSEPFAYETFTTRNIGFVSAQEQERLRDARIFVCGVGGMGGAAFMALVRAGIGHFVIADIDCFETSNLNRQVFATAATLGIAKKLYDESRKPENQRRIKQAGRVFLRSENALMGL